MPNTFDNEPGFQVNTISDDGVSDSDTDPGWLDSMMSADEAILLNLIVPEPGQILPCPWGQPNCTGSECAICRTR